MHDVAVSLQTHEALLGDPLDLDDGDVGHGEYVEQLLLRGGGLLFPLLVAGPVDLDLCVVFDDEPSRKDLIPCLFLRVRLREELRRRLSEVDDLALCGNTYCLVGDLVEVDLVLIGEVVEDVHGLFGLLATLLAAENQVDPAAQIERGPLCFKCTTLHCNEGVRTASRRPWRQTHIVHTGSSLLHAEIKLLQVQKELRETEKLWCQFAHV